jgi:predicted transposase YbfD/YdcC
MAFSSWRTDHRATTPSAGCFATSTQSSFGPVHGEVLGRLSGRGRHRRQGAAPLLRPSPWQGGAEHGQRETAGQTTSETAFYLLRQTVTPERWNAIVRPHWEIENCLHWRLDVVMNEDQDRTRLGHGPQNLAGLRHMVLNAMEKEGSKGYLRGKLKRAGWDEAFLARLLAMF